MVRVLLPLSPGVVWRGGAGARRRRRHTGSEDEYFFEMHRNACLIEEAQIEFVGWVGG